jgi:hypothetical protein
VPQKRLEARLKRGYDSVNSKLFGLFSGIIPSNRLNIFAVGQQLAKTMFNVMTFLLTPAPANASPTHSSHKEKLI